jgi:hypothetical protein
MDLGTFYALTKKVTDYEKLVKNAKKELNKAYSELCPVCPHSESIQAKVYGGDRFRICKICGIEDRGSKGGTPGDEYDYGYPGYPDDSFWGDSDVEYVDDEKKLWKYRRSTHHWIVRDGKAVDEMEKYK